LTRLVGERRQLVYHVTTAAAGGAGGAVEASRYEIGGKPVTGDENVSPSAPPGRPPASITLRTENPQAERGRQQPADPSNSRRRLQVTRAQTAYTHRKLDSRRRSAPGPRYLGLSSRLTHADRFAAVGDIYVMPIDGKAGQPHERSGARQPIRRGRLTARSCVLVRQGQRAPSAWIRDLRTGHSRAVTHLTTQPQARRGRRMQADRLLQSSTAVARGRQMSILDVASGTVTKVHDTLPQPGTPTWSRMANGSRSPMWRR